MLKMFFKKIYFIIFVLAFAQNISFIKSAEAGTQNLEEEYLQYKHVIEKQLANNFVRILYDYTAKKNFFEILKIDPKLSLKLKDQFEKHIDEVQYYFDVFINFVIALIKSEAPLDYIAGLILKIEQMNNFFSLLFDQIGDNAETIYKLAKNIIFKNPEVKIGDFEWWYRSFTQDEQRKIKNYFLQKYNDLLQKKDLTFAQMLEISPNMPKVILEKEFNVPKGVQTQSKQHLFSVISLFELKEHLKNPEIKDFFLKVYAQEKLEHTNGNYVFYHARKWNWNLQSDIYKQLWNIVKNDHVGQNYQFLRFGSMFPGHMREDLDLLFMNSAIFGNMENLSSSTAYYWLKNFDNSLKKEIPSSIKAFFGSFNLESLYDKYREEFEELVKLHSQSSSYGEILLISVPADKLNNIIPTSPSEKLRYVDVSGKLTKNTKEILDAIKKDPKSVRRLDELEWGLILGIWKNNVYYLAPYANDPHNGPAVYSFYLADEKVMDEYQRKRDALFEKIKNDYAEIQKAKKTIPAMVINEKPEIRAKL